MEKCLICGQEFSTYRGFALHLNGSHGMSTKNYLDTYVYSGITPKCDKCGSDKVWNHRGRYDGCSIRCDKNDNYEECEICKLRCDDLSDLSIHVKIVHKLDFKDYLDTYVYKGIAPTCKQCGLPMTYYKGRYKDHSDNCHLLHKCYICGEHYTLNHLLSRHVKHDHKINKFKDYLDNYVPGNPPKCSKCGADLEFEFGSYTDRCSKRCGSPFKCEICGVGFGALHTLNRHIHFIHNMDTNYYADNYVWNGSPPRCNQCGNVREFYKGRYQIWCQECSPNHNHVYRHCKRGWYESEKVLDSRFYYRSSHEHIACQLLDNDPNVRYFYKGPTIRMDDGSNYFMDFYVIMANNSTKLIEVKPKNNIMDEMVQRKIQAASLYAKDNCIDEVVFWSESNLYSEGVQI